LIIQAEGEIINKNELSLIKENSITITSTFYVFNVPTFFQLSHFQAGDIKYIDGNVIIIIINIKD